jgi:hypothetical protein
LDEYTKKLIKQFMQNYKAKEHDPMYKITPDKCRYFWKGATEQTYYGCDILYFGTCKAESFSEIIMELDDLITDISLQTGYSPLRWRITTDALLLKKSGVRLVEKLRTTVLFQGYFKYMNKYIGCHMLKDSETYEQLAWENMGVTRERRLWIKH